MKGERLMFNIKYPPLPSCCSNCALYKCQYSPEPYCAQNGPLRPCDAELEHDCFIPAIDIIMQLDKDFQDLESLEEIYDLCDLKYR